MIPILLLDLAGVILVIGYVLLDRHQNSSTELPSADIGDRGQPSGPQGALPIEPIIAQRPLPSDVAPRRIRRPSPAPGRSAAAGRAGAPVSRSDEA